MRVVQVEFRTAVDATTFGASARCAHTHIIMVHGDHVHAYAHLHAITKRRVALHGLRLLATHAANADRFIIRRLRRCTDGEVIMLDHL